MGVPSNLLNMFAEQPVSLLYYLSVILLSQAALLMALGQRLRGSSERAAGRYAVASAGVMISWIVLMIGAMVVLLTGRPVGNILPPLDRAVNAMVVLLIGWAFLSADLQTSDLSWRILTVGASIGGLLVAAGYVYTAVQWYGVDGADFNTSIYSVGWAIGTVVLAVIGLLLLLARFRKTLDAPLKLTFFALVLAGYLYTLVMAASGTLSGDADGALRLAFLAAMPFLPIVVYRLVVDRLIGLVDLKSSQVAQASLAVLNAATSTTPMVIDSNMEREAVAVLRALGLMIEHEQPEDMPYQIVVSVATALKADVTALLVLDDAEYADVIAAYDHIQQKHIAAMALKMDEQPTLQEAVTYRRQRPLGTDHNLNELVDLYTRLDVQKIGPAYFQPLSREGQVIGVLIVALPYTQRELRENETNLLEALAPVSARLLAISRMAQRSRFESADRAVQAVVDSNAAGNVQPTPQADPQEAATTSAMRAEMQSSLEVARSQIGELSALVRELQIELDYERGRIAEISADDAEGLSITQRMARMSAERAQLEAEREKLMQALQEAQTQLASASGDEGEVYETMVRVLQQERNELQSQKEQLEAQLTDIRARGQAAAPAMLRDMLTNLSEEKARLSVERDGIKAQLGEVETQLKALGIEGGPLGLATVIMKLTEDRSHFKAVAERAVQDRDTLLAERQRISDLIATEAKRATRMTAMETAIRRLAADREALMRQRDSLRNERDQSHSDSAQWEAQRVKMIADMAALQADLEEITFDRNHAVGELDKFAGERAALLTERDRLSAERTAVLTERDQLLARIEGNRDTLQKLGADGVGALKIMIDDLTEERSELEHRLLRSQDKIRTLEQDNGKLKSQVAHSVPLPTGTALDASQAEVMLSIAQELRTPMTSITGYVDLLIGESIGILGALQRDFLQRVKANTDRLGTLLEDFIRVTAIDTGQMNFTPENVDMISVIDDAITETRTQFREKGITLLMDLPDNLPALQGDRDALKQVMIQLLSNAYLASSTDGEVTITTKFEPAYRLTPRRGSPSEPTDAIYISVRDAGGGIPPEEQGRVFSRLYRADNPLIQGLGDTGVGLSIARALTELHGGQIWLDSTLGVGSTFKLVLPLQGATRPERIANAAT